MIDLLQLTGLADLPGRVTEVPFGVGVLAGPPMWTFFEYVLHRGFHESRGRNYASREHLRHHGSEDTVLESWFLSWAGVVLVGFGLIPVLGRLVGLDAFGAGLGLGYVVGYGTYDWIHWRAHRRPIANRYEARVRKHHFTHHFCTPMQNHGVTTTLWDRVFGTYVEVEQVEVPRRLAMRWLLDEHGEIRAEYQRTYVLRGSRALDAGQKRIDHDRAMANEAPLV